MTSWQLYAFGSAVFAALTAILGKIGIAGVPPDLGTFIRTIVVVIMAGAIAASFGQFSALAAISAKSWIFLCLSGLATGASWLLYYRALQLGPASQVAPIDKLSVVLVAIFGVIFLGENLSWTHWGGIALIAAGVLILTLK